MGCVQSNQHQPVQADAPALQNNGSDSHVNGEAKKGGEGAKAGGGAGDASRSLTLNAAQEAPPLSTWDPLAPVDTRLFPDEVARLEELRSCGILNTPPDPRFDSITRLMSTFFNVPVALVSLIDDNRLWLKSVQGPLGSSAPRQGTFCNMLLLPSRHEMLIVENAKEDVRCSAIPIVSNDPGICFYAGAPLVGSEGHRLGSLCVLDVKPRTFSAASYNTLTNFAELVVREMERDKMKALRARPTQAGAAPASLLREASAFSEAVALLEVATHTDWPLAYANDAWAATLGPAPPGQGSQHQQQQGGEGQRASSQPFWALFVPDTDARQAADAAVAAGTPTRLQLVHAVTGRAHDVVLRPAATDQLQTAIVVGIPSYVSMDDGQGCGSGEGKAGGKSGSAARFWFAVVQREEAAASSANASSTAPPGPSEAGPSGGAHNGQAGIAPPFTHAGSDGAAAGQGSAAGASAAPRPAAPAAAPSAGGPGVPGKQVALFGATVSVGLVGPPGSNIALSSGISSPKTSSLASVDSVSVPASSTPSSVLRDKNGAGKPAAAQQGELLLRHGMLAPAKLGSIELGPLLGSGANGRVYRGKWNGVVVAVKVLETSDGQSELAEAKRAYSLRHPNIVQTYTYASHEMVDTLDGTQAQVWIVQKFCNRGNLYSGIERGWLRASRSPSGAPNRVAILHTAVEIASALTYLHAERIIHGDLAGTNVLLDYSMRDERRWSALVGDFGLAPPLPPPSALGATHGGLLTTRHGTVSHQPPELLTDGILTPAADIWALGVLLWEMWAGRRAFVGLHEQQVVEFITSGASCLELPPGTPADYKALCERCLDRDHTRRPAAGAVLKQLLAMLNEHNSDATDSD